MTISNSVNGTHTTLMKAAMLMCACPLDSLDVLCYGLGMRLDAAWQRLEMLEYDSLGHKESILTTMSDADSFDDSYCLCQRRSFQQQLLSLTKTKSLTADSEDDSELL